MAPASPPHFTVTFYAVISSRVWYPFLCVCVEEQVPQTSGLISVLISRWGAIPSGQWLAPHQQFMPVWITTEHTVCYSDTIVPPPQSPP